MATFAQVRIHVQLGRFVEVRNQHSSDKNLIFSTCFVDKFAREQTFINVDSNENFRSLLIMYEMEKELIIYTSTMDNIDTKAKEQRYKHVNIYKTLLNLKHQLVKGTRNG
ncbi:hypothetical protein R6Q59_004191 [Mikania micrantha]